MTTSLEPGATVAPGVPGPAIGRLAELPGVNLMPPEIAEHVAVQRTKAACGAAVVLSLVAVAGLYYQAQHGVTSARSDLAAAQQQQVGAAGSVSKLQPVAAVYAQVTEAKTQVSEALGGEIRWSGKLNDLSLSIPANVWLTSLTVTTGGSANGALATTGLDSISFQGLANSRDTVATWLNSLATEKGYTNPYVSSTAETVIGSRVFVSFTSTVTVTAAALSGRYTPATAGEN